MKCDRCGSEAELVRKNTLKRANGDLEVKRYFYCIECALKEYGIEAEDSFCEYCDCHLPGEYFVSPEGKKYCCEYCALADEGLISIEEDDDDDKD